MKNTKPSIVIVVQDGIIQEVAVTAPKETLYRVIDLDEGVEQEKDYGDFYAESTGIEVEEFTKEKLGE